MAQTVIPPSAPPAVGAFFRRHRSLYALSMAGAVGSAGYAARAARRVEGARAAAWWTLAGLTVGQAVGMAVLRRRALTDGGPPYH